MITRENKLLKIPSISITKLIIITCTPNTLSYFFIKCGFFFNLLICNLAKILYSKGKYLISVVQRHLMVISYLKELILLTLFSVDPRTLNPNSNTIFFHNIQFMQIKHYLSSTT